MTEEQHQEYESKDSEGALKCRRLAAGKDKTYKDAVKDGGQGHAKDGKSKGKYSPKKDGTKKVEVRVHDLTVAEEPTSSDITVYDEPTLLSSPPYLMCEPRS